MKQLNREAFDRARRFLRMHARPLDRALFEYRFEQAPIENVLRELAHYQNDDGGFGKALEPDLRTPSSSALATGIGLRLVKEMACSAHHAMVRKAIEFLRATFDEQAQVWQVAPRDANSFPHAPWWHDDGESLARTFDGFQIIPRVEIVGLLHHFSSQVPTEWLSSLTERTVTCIETIQGLGSGGGDDLAYTLSLAETKELPEHWKSRLAKRARTVAPSVVSHDPQEWASYCILPLKLAPSPHSLVADLLEKDVQLHLDYVIDHQTAEGAWEPNWTWDNFYPDEWEKAKVEWQGHLTLETLTTLRAFGRIENKPQS